MHAGIVSFLQCGSYVIFSLKHGSCAAQNSCNASNKLICDCCEAATMLQKLKSSRNADREIKTCRPQLVNDPSALKGPSGIAGDMRGGCYLCTDSLLSGQGKKILPGHWESAFPHSHA